MAHKTLIGGTAYEISGGKTLVNGTAYKIDKGRTLVSGTGYDISFGLPAVFADATWEQIISACQNKTVPDTWNVADQKAMTIDGRDYMIDIIGKNHDMYSDGTGTAPLTFQLHGSYFYGFPINNTNTNSGGYGSSVMHTTHLPSVLASMPTAIQNAIKQVNKKASAGSMSTSIETIACKLFLLAEIEIFGEATHSISGEGTQYAYYSEGNSKIKYDVTGRAIYWWVRSPYPSNIYAFNFVREEGICAPNGGGNSNAIVPAFCF